jgi:ADP-heptose:LPS heptosyltransferase
VLRPRALGDVLLITPVLRALRAQFPEAAIDVGVDDTVAAILDRNPHVDHRWIFPRRRPHRRRDWLPIYSGIARARYQLVIDLHGSPRTAMFTLLSRARYRAGYDLRGRRYAYNIRIPRDTDRRGRHSMLYAGATNLEFIARCGVNGEFLEDTRLVYVCNPRESIQGPMRQLAGAPEGGKRIALAPAGTWPSKTADPALFSAMADQLIDQGERVLLLWGPGEESLSRLVADTCSDEVQVAPATSLDELAVVLQNVDLLISHDSGIKHLAVAVGTPTLTLIGPTDPRAWMPNEGPHDFVRADVPCVGCNFTQCAHRSCMKLLSAPTIVSRAMALLERSAMQGTA